MLVIWRYYLLADLNKLAMLNWWAEVRRPVNMLSRSITNLQKLTASDDIATSRFFQLRILSVRFMRTWMRSPVNLLVQLAQYTSFGLVIGAEALRSWDKSESGEWVLDRTCCMVLAEM